MSNHEEEVVLNVVTTGQHPIVLGLPWLKAHNSTIDWPNDRITFSSPYYSTHCLDASSDVFAVETEPETLSEEEVDLFTVNGELCSGRSNFSAEIASKHVQKSKSLEEMVPKEYHDFLHLFKKEGASKLPPHREHDMAINLNPTKPLPKPSGLYPMSDAELKELKQWLDEMLGRGFIQPSKSPIAAPYFFVPKKDTTSRLMVNWQRLNDITIKDQYPLPRTDEIVDRLRGATIFSKMDLRWGYNLVRIKEGDEWKTAFRTRYGLFEFKVMHFDLCNAPAVFQRLMNEVLSPVLDVSATNYLDDTMSYAKNKPDNVATNRTILS